MFTILIPCLKKGFLKKQLEQLANQDFKEFSVIVMDTNYKHNKDEDWITKKYPFSLTHLPITQHIKQAKRYDFSIKNNLAQLSLTNHFLFLSDTHMPKSAFTSHVYKSLILNSPIYFRVASDLPEHSETSPIILFNKTVFFTLLNGYDEVTTYASKVTEQMWVRYLGIFNRRLPKAISHQVIHINHDSINNFG